MPPEDANVDIPISGDGSPDEDNNQEPDEENTMNEKQWEGMMSIAAAKHIEGLEHTANGARYLHETMRLGHERRIDVVSFREATGIRHTAEAGETSTQSNARANPS